LAADYDAATLHPMSPVGVLIVDDQETFRRIGRELISATPGFVCLADAASAEEALEAAVALRPSLALVDVKMPGIDGLETTRRLRAALPGAVVVLVSANGDRELEAAAAACGAAAFVPKQRLTPTALHTLWERHGPA
jgi:two-component system, NarL family, invasion response regulator UvrY